jgi:para-aminobenzoate synthetase component 1
MSATPHVLEIPYTDPLAAFARFAADPYATFLDSALTADKRGRYSFIAADPFLTLTSKNGNISLGQQIFVGDPFYVLREQLTLYPLASLPGLPPFQTGVAGYFGYDLCHHLERLPSHRLDDMQFPDLALGFYDVVIAFDHQQQRAWIFSSGYPEREPRARQDRARARAEAFQSLITDPPAPPSTFHFPPFDLQPPTLPALPTKPPSSA